MRLSIKAKLALLVGAALVALAMSAVGSAILSAQQAEHLDQLESRLVPKLELGPQIEGAFDALTRSFQDAVAAEDAEMLARADALHDELHEAINAGQQVLDAARIAPMRVEVDAYHQVAMSVSQRLLRGETGETLVEDMRAMQARQTRVLDLVQEATQVDRADVLTAFAAARNTDALGRRLRLGINLVSLVLVLGLSAWLIRGVMRSVSALSVGLARFGRGALDTPIELRAGDELARVAEHANRMAESLADLVRRHEERDWLQSGWAAVGGALQGDLSPEEVAARSLRTLGDYVGAVAGALYVQESGGVLTLHSHVGCLQPPRSFAAGDGLVGQVATGTALRYLEQVPPNYLRVSSGLGEAPPGVLLLAPLVHDQRTSGVVELAFFNPVGEAVRELVSLLGPTIAVALQVATSRNKARALLAETQEQAGRLMTQEEELRTHNDQLQMQQEELRQANEELELQRRLLNERNRDLEATRGSLEDKAQELQRVSAYKSQFLTKMSHELRTPLNSMLLLSGLMAEHGAGPLTEKQTEYCRTMHAAGGDLLHLINGLLDLARIESGKHQITLSEVSLENLATSARRLFAPLAIDKGLEFQVDVEEGLPQAIVSDHRSLEQIIVNLVGNAIKYTEQGSVTLQFQRPRCGTFRRCELSRANAIEIAVTDTGPGIASVDQARILLAFEQVSDSNARLGTGLGLTITTELLDLLGGELDLESELNRGATFSAYLPMDARTGSSGVAALASGTARPPIPEVAERNHSSKRPRPLLLVIEDDALFAEELVRVIEGGGFDARTAGLASEGLRLARELCPSGIILDVRLPDGSGIDLLKTLRRDAATRDVPVHFISAIDAEREGLELGAVGFLTKPASREQLTRVVALLTGRGSRTGDSPPRILLAATMSPETAALEQHLTAEGLSVVHVTTAADALRTAAGGGLSGAVVDLEFSGSDGLEWPAELRRAAQRGNADALPVLVQTARPLSSEETLKIGVHCNAIVLREGYSTERLLAEVRLFVQHLREGLGSSAPRLDLGAVPDVRLEGHHFLVVDDDMRTVYALSALLEAKGAKVSTASNGKAAVEALGSRNDVSCVLMDVMMPEMDGHEATRQIRKDPRFGTLPIIAVTAKAMENERNACLQAGASDYLAKPINATKLFEVLSGHLELEARTNGHHAG